MSGSFGGVGGGGGFSTPATPQTFGGAFGSASGLAQRVNDNIAVDRRLNAIVLTGTPDVVADDYTVDGLIAALEASIH